MLWVINPKPSDEFGDLSPVSDACAADLANLREVGDRVIDGTRAEVTTPLPPAVRLADGEAIYVLAHAGFAARGGWVGGMYFKDFATQFAAKFGQRLNGRIVYFLVCYVGQDIAALGQALADAVPEKFKFTIFAPVNLMFVSTTGAPRVFSGEIARDKADDIVEKAGGDASRVRAGVLQAPGNGWAGARIDSSTAVAMKDADVTAAIVRRFGS